MSKRIGPAAVLAMVTAVLVSSCGQAPKSSLYYVWLGSHCPTPTKKFPSKPAGFTSWKAAEQAAQIETTGPRVYYRQRISMYERQLKAAERDAESAEQIQTLRADVRQAEANLAGYAQCTRYVRKGVADKTLPKGY